MDWFLPRLLHRPILWVLEVITGLVIFFLVFFPDFSPCSLEVQAKVLLLLLTFTPSSQRDQLLRLVLEALKLDSSMARTHPRYLFGAPFSVSSHLGIPLTIRVSTLYYLRGRDRSWLFCRNSAFEWAFTLRMTSYRRWWLTLLAEHHKNHAH